MNNDKSAKFGIRIGNEIAGGRVTAARAKTLLKQIDKFIAANDLDAEYYWMEQEQLQAV